MKQLLLITTLFMTQLALADIALTPGMPPLVLENGQRVFCVNTYAAENTYSCVCRHKFVDSISFGVTVKSSVSEPYLLGEGAIQEECAKLGYFKYQPASIKANPRDCRRN